MMKRIPSATSSCDANQKTAPNKGLAQPQMPLIYLQRLASVLLLALIVSLTTFFGLLGWPQPLRAAGPHYVSANGVDSANCLISNPCRTIQQAVTNAAGGDEIRVAAGLYTGTITLNKNLSLRGGFTTTNWLTPNPAQNSTIINAQGLGRVIQVSSVVVATVSGFHLTGGNGPEGAGVYNQSGALTLSDNQIYGNTATGNGGGVYNQATLTSRGNQIYSNTASTGGGLYFLNASTTLLEATEIFSNNSQFGGGIYVDNSPVTVRSSLIYSNTATELGGGGVFVQSGNVKLENNTIYDNYATPAGLNPVGGGLYIFTGTVAITNSLIVSNTALNGGGIYSDGIRSGLSLAYNDFFGNSPNHIEDSGAINPTTVGTNNRVSNPQFVNPQAFNLHLSSPGSPALDSGTTATSAAIDIDGEGRPFGSGMDRGADEHTDLSSSCYARVQNGQVYTTVQAAVDAASAGSTVQVAGLCQGVQSRSGLQQTAYISKSLTVHGGYTVTDWLNASYGPTILDAQGSGRVVYVTGTASVVLDSLHLTGGATSAHGAGVYLGGSGSATLQNNAIYGNTASTSNGGGVYNIGGAALLQHNTIFNNSAEFGGGVYANSSGGVVTLRNTIVATNTATTAGGGVASTANVLSLGYNDAFGNTPDNYNGPFSVDSTNLSVPPNFVNPTGNPPNFHLQYNSALVNAADPASSLSTDFESDSRPQGTRSDIGADESGYYPGVALSDAPGVIVTDTNLIRGTFITFSHTITNTGLNPTLTDTFNITFSNNNGWPVTLAGVSSPVGLATGASLTFDVVVSVPFTVTGGIYNQTIVTATSQTNGAAFDQTIDLIANPGVQLAPNYEQSASPGEVLTYTHTLTNIGPVTDTFVISLNSPFGWGQLIAPTTSITVGPGATALVTARVQVTDTAAANLSDVMTVTATSVVYANVSATAVDTTTAKATVGDRYVATTGQNTNNNCTRSTLPCATISYAVGQTAFSDTVRVAGGTYLETGILINQYINLRGGFTTGNWVTPDPELNVTTIDAQNNGRGLLIQVSSAFRPVVEGFTIRNAATSGVGGAIYVQGSSAPTLTRLILLNSSATRGGGIYIETGNPVLQNITISNTTATQGGGIYQQAGNVNASQLAISNTVASNQGGGIYHAGGTLTISQTRLSGNSAVNAGGGFYSAGGTLNLWNNFIYNNTVSSGGGGGVYKGPGTLNAIHNSLVGNQASTSGGGIFANNSTALVISNTIIVSNTATTGGGIHRTGGGSVSVDYNDVWNNTGGDYSGVAAGPNSISTNPLFVDESIADYHLSLTSPALDRGDPSTSLKGDIDGEQRPFNQGFDLGADELGGCLAQIEGNSEIYTLLQQAVDIAGSGAVIRISGTCRGAQGRLVSGQTLSQTVIITKNLTLKGGYNSTFDNDPETNPQPTTLDALSLGRVVVVTDTIDVTISRLTLTGGNGAAGGGNSGGGGIYHAANQLKLEATVITGNQATAGGGLYLAGGTLTLGNDTGTKAVTITTNSATNGGGLYLNAGSATISHTTIATNTATTSGGGVYNAGGLINSQSLTITGNSAADGGGLRNTGSGTLNLINSIVASNAATNNGGGLYNDSNNLTVRHDNFYANNAGNEGGGIYHNSASSAPVINSSVIISNTAGGAGSGIRSANVSPVFNYNDVFNNTNVGASGTGNISVNPNFLSTDPASGTFLRIAGGSPIEDKGDPNSPVLIDIDANPRPSNQSFDIGIDEVGGCFVRINLQPPTYGSVQFAAGLSNPGDTLNVAGTCQGASPFVDGGQTVSQTVFLTKSLTLRGGYNKDDWQEAPDPSAYPTILDALNLGRVVYITNSAVISISDLNLRQGTAVNGGGIFMGSGVLTLTNNSVYSNSATNGGAFFHAGGVSVVQNNIIRHNSATSGGGIYNNTGNGLSVRHNTLYANSATNGGGFYNNSGSPTVVNTIFATNTVTSLGHAIFGAVSFTPRYNDAFPAANAYSGVSASNSLSVDPLFVNAAAGDFHLQNTSPVIDRGDPAMTLDFDFENDMRPSDQGFDMGADEQAGCRARIERTGVIYGNIQRAVDNSIPGDVVQVSVGECRGVHTIVSGGQTLSQTVHVTHNLTLHGGFSLDFTSGGDTGPAGYPDPSASTIDAMGLGRPVLVTNSVAITMMRFNLVNGNATGLGGGPGGAAAGGGLYYNGSRGRLEHVDFYSNTAAYGGAFYNAGTNFEMYNSWINFNVATVDGGAIFNTTGVMTITGEPESTRIYSNTATSRGGGIFNDSGQLWLMNNNSVELTLNQANQGGFAYNNSGQMVLENNVIFDNEASQGGALYNNTGSLTLDRGNRLFDNNATTDGGAIYNGSGSLTTWNTFIYGNTASDQGGGIYLTSGSPNILHNTFYQNDAGNQGGGVFVSAGSPTLKDNIFDNNTAGSGSAVHAPASAVLDYNDYWTANGPSQVAGGANSGANSLNVNPRFVAPNLFSSADFHLQATSGLINVGQNVSVPHDFEDDPRPINTAPDIGADEYNACLAKVMSSGIVYGRIQTALNNANSGDSIRVAQGVCQESVTIDKNITISGSWLPDFSAQVDPALGPVTTIDALNANRVITATNAANSVNLSRVRLINGNTGGNGGGLYSQASQLTLTDMTVFSNTAAHGGGVFIDNSGTANLNNLSITDNNAVSGNGGGVYNGPNTNVTLFAGGVTDNSASGNGGGVYNDSGSQVHITGGSPIDRNQAQNGAGIFNNAATFTLHNKQVNRNQATNNGGGIYISGSSAITLTNLGLYDNTAQSNGGGFYRSASGSAALYHATIHQNDALGGQGGGVYNASSSMVISASIIAFNTSLAGGSGVHGAATVNVAYTLRESGNTYVGVTGSDNIDGADPDLREPGGDLLYTSPAIDAVPTSASSVTVDRFDEPRPQLCAKDMGRDEYLVGARTLTWIGPTPAGPETVAPTQAVTYTYAITNNSENWTAGFSLGPGTGYTETLTITLNSSQNWGKVISITGGANPTIVTDTIATVALAPGQAANISVQVTVPAGTFADKVDTTTLSYQSYQCQGGGLAAGTSSPATTNVEQSLLFIIAPDNFGAALPGQAITYTHIVTNLGNLTDTYTIVPGANLYAPGEIIQPPAPYTLTLAPLQTGTVVMSVTVDAAAAGGLTARTNVVAISGGDPSLQESALDSTVISYTTGTRYVSLDGTDSLVDETIGNPDPNAVDHKDNNCTQPNQGSCRTIQQALDQAADGDLIKINQGTYTQPFTDIVTTTYKSQVITQVAFINKSITLQGGYDKDNNGWDESPPSHISQTTTLDPQGLGRAIYVTEDITPTIDRLKLANGDAANLGGGPGDVDAGGNLYNEGANLTLSALRLYNGDADVGGSLYSGNGSLLLQNNLLHGNQAITGGAVYVGNGTATLQNNTFFNNSTTQRGGAVYVDTGSLVMTNTIVATHTTGGAGSGAVHAVSSATMKYNLYYNNSGGNTGGVAAVDPTDVLNDPGFNNPGSNPPDLHLTSTSPARDTGDPATGLTIDYDNDLRPLGPGFDIGADERVPAAALLFFPDTVTTTLAGSIVVQTHTLQNTGDVTDTFTISASSTQPSWPTFDQPVPYTITLGPNISQTVVVTYAVPITANGQSNITVLTATSSVTTVFATVTDVITVSSAVWQISKTVTPTPTVQPGGRLTYTLFITNVGDLDTSGTYTITDPLPAHTNFVSASAPGTFGSGNVTWVSSTPVTSNGGVISVTFVVTVTRPLTHGTAIVNQNYSIIGGGTPTQTIGASITVTVDAPATLSITKTASASPVQPGDYLTYTLTISNDGTALGPALGVVISDTLPAEAIYQSMGFVAPASGIVTDTGDPTLLWQLADPIPVGGSAQVTVTTRVTSPLAAGTTLTNTFATTASNIATTLSGVITTPVTATNSITLAKTVVPTTTVPGGLVTYTITLTNSGNGLANVSLTDTLATGFTPASYTTTVVVPGRSWSTSEGVATVTFTANAPMVLGTFYNQVITATFGQSQTTLSNTAPVTVEAPLVDFNSLTYSVAENGGPAVITVTLSSASSVTATVNYTTTDNTATAGSDYAARTGVLTFSPGITSQTFSVPITDDAAFEGDETVILTLGAPSGAGLGSTNNPATLTIVDNDTAPDVQFNSATYSVGEGNTTATITVTLSAASSITATVNYTTTDNTATAGSDYAGRSGVLTFTPGITSQTFTVPITDDVLFESNETVQLSLSGAVNANLGTPNPATLTIVDNDTAPDVQFSSATYSVGENGGPAVITVTLSAVSGVTATVNYATSNNTATAGSDYGATNGVLTFSPGLTSQTFTVPITDDVTFESNETLTLTLTAPVSASLGSPGAATLTIVEDDPVPVVGFSSATYSVNENAGTASITVTLSAASSVTATVNYASSDNTATAGSDYAAVGGTLTFAPGVTSQSFTVPITNDVTIEGDETLTLSLTSPVSATIGVNPASLTIVDDDVPTLDFSSVAYSVNENGGSATITVTLSGASPLTATVDYATANATATAGSDYAAVNGTLTFTPGLTSQSFTVPITDDALFESNETIQLNLTNGINATLGVTNNPATLTILDDDAGNIPEVQFSSAAYSVGENGGPAVITVTLSAISGVTATVNYATSNNTATAGSDYRATNGVLTFSPGLTSQIFTVPITDDVAFEGDETLNLTLSGVISANLGSPSTATLTIVEDEAAPTLDFSSATYSLNEADGPALITVTLSSAAAVTVTTSYATSDNTATAGSDYASTSGLLTFAPGVVVQTFSVPITDDSVFEMNETITLTLSGAVNAILGVDTATLTILNDDATPAVDFSSATYSFDEGAGSATITVTLSAAFPLTATVDYSSAANSATAGSDYTDVSGTLTFTPGVTSLTFNVPLTDDLLYESSETVTLTLSNPVSTTIGPNSPAVLTIVDNDTPVVDFSSATYSVGETAGTALITVTLSTTPTLPGSVDYASSDNTATAGSDYGPVNNTLALTPGQTTYTFTVSISDDLSFEGNETLTLTLSNPISAALGSANNPATLTIVDNDPLPTVDFSTSAYSVNEAAGPATITVTLSAASSVTATVNYATSNNTATAGSDYAASSGILTFTPGLTNLTFSVPITNDLVFEGNEIVSLTLSGAVSATLGSANNPAALTIVDDETAPVVGFSSPAYSIAEAGGSATITVTLSAASSVTATVNYATSDNTATAGSDYIAASGTLTFTPGLTSLTFTVPITNDAVQEGNETITLTLSSPVSATLGTNPAALTIVDDDNPTVDFSSATYSVNESAGTATITVTLSATPNLTVNVNYAASDITATAGSDYVAASGTLTFTPGITSRTFTVPITNDVVFENNETVRLTLSAPSNAILGSVNNPATLTIIDNDPAPTVDFSSPAYSISEAGGTATITVTLSAVSGITATVNFATVQNTASAGLDYLGAGGGLTFAPGVTTRTFTVSILNDSLFENSEMLTLTLSSPVSATLGTTNNPATLTIVDNDPAPAVNFSSPTYSIGEAGGSATITVTLSAASGITATVNYATSDNTATASSDYAAASGTLTFSPGATSLTFSVPITNDVLLESNETVTLTLSSPVSATLGATNPAMLTIVDNDTPTVGFSSTAYSVDEGAGTATITVTLSFASSLTTTVNYATSNNTATAGSDYVAQSGTLTFSPGITRQTFTVPITDDAVLEANETVTLTLSASVNAILSPVNNPARLTIMNNDQAIVYLPMILRDFVPTPPPADGPDLVVTNITLTPLGGNTYRIDMTARNQGNQPVTFGNNFHVNLYLDGNFSNPIITHGVQASWFGVGQSRVLSANYTFSSGSHTLRGWADPYNVVVEANESNNTLDTGVTITGLNNEIAPQNNPALPAGPLPTPTMVP